MFGDAMPGVINFGGAPSGAVAAVSDAAVPVGAAVDSADGVSNAGELVDAVVSKGGALFSAVSGSSCGLVPSQPRKPLPKSIAVPTRTTAAKAMTAPVELHHGFDRKYSGTCVPRGSSTCDDGIAFG